MLIAALGVGTVVAGRFVLEAVAGAGGMGTVYRAFDRETHRTVALKVCHAADRKPAHLTRFLREAKILAELHDPGIVAYIAHGQTADESPYLVMEWLEGEDLGQRLGRAPLTMAQSLSLARRIAAGLAAAHRAGVVHRDLKPSNVFLRGGRTEDALLLDFGIARWATRSTLTATGVVLGTPQYMAPEQARGIGELTPAADVFSLGCVLFECLAGRSPFVGAHLAAILAKIVFEAAPRLGSLRNGAPQALEDLVDRMLAKEPAHRPADAAALLEELAALPEPPDDDAPGASTAAPPPPPPAQGDAEQQMLSVILAQPPPADDASATESSEERLGALRAALAAYECRVEVLADGAATVIFAQTARTAATDRAAQAARAALVLRDRWPGSRVALASGLGLVRERSLSAGDAVDRAARLLAATTDDDGAHLVRVDEVTAGLIEAAFVLRPAGAGRLLLHEREALDASRPLLGRPTPCVGREQELSMLLGILESCIDEPCARGVVVRAAPGTGKSRLRHELVRRATARRTDLTVLLGHGDSLSAGSSYGLLSHALRGLAGVADGMPLEEQQHRLAACVGARVTALSAARVAAFLGEMCGIPFPDEPLLRSARHDAGLMAEQIAGAFLELLGAECDAHPVLLVLEDLHWGDRLTVRLCDLALDVLTERPLLILALARPEIDELFPRMWADRSRHGLQLGPLPRRVCQHLARDVLGEAVPDTLIERLVQRSAGNALFLEELIRAAAAGQGDELPETVLAMLHARLMRLSPEARRVLRAASVFGETFWLGGVRALSSDEQAEALEVLLATLVEAEVIEPQRGSRLAGESQYRFRHALVRDAAYSMLSDHDRAVAHGLAGRYLEAAGERDPMLLVEHYERGAEPARAAFHGLRAAEQALGAADSDAAIARALRGLACNAEGDTRVKLRSVLCVAYGHRNDFRSAAPHADEVLALAEPGSIPWSMAVATAQAAADLLGQPRKADEIERRLLATEPQGGALTAAAFAYMTRAYMLSLGAQWDRLGVVERRARDLIEPRGAGDPVARGWMEMIPAMLELLGREDAWSGRSWAERACASFREAGHRIGELCAQVILANSLWTLGLLSEAEQVLRGTMVFGAQMGPMSVQRTADLFGVLLDRGELDAAAELANAFAPASAERAAFDAGTSRWMLADVLHRRGALADAERAAREACQLLRDVPFQLGPARVSLAAILLAAGHAAAALDEATAALAMYDGHRLWARKGERARLVHAECLAAAGDAAAARAALERAHAHLLAKAARIPDPASRARFLEELPEHARLAALARAWGQAQR